ncbi:MAG: hypothetical protein QG635_292, partial [Bacteroidota bacterium]|nr:hypothetical protein [Bacteroidota bacterium]
PFFRNAVIGDVVYTGVVFGAFTLVERFVPAVATA